MHVISELNTNQIACVNCIEKETPRIYKKHAAGKLAKHSVSDVFYHPAGLERGLACKQAALVWKLPHFAPEVELK
jgi:hypothetical protein